MVSLPSCGPFMKEEYKTDPTRDYRSLYFCRKGHRENGLRERFKTESTTFNEIDPWSFLHPSPSHHRVSKNDCLCSSLMIVLLRPADRSPAWVCWKRNEEQGAKRGLAVGGAGARLTEVSLSWDVMILR